MKKQLIKIQEQASVLYYQLKDLLKHVGYYEFDRLTISKKISSPLDFLDELSDRLGEWIDELEG